ncbi:MAG: hypothetical protein ACOH2M_21080 [Cypionkella sp.]
MTNRALQPALLAAALAFAAAPLVTPPFMGYDPTIFPVVIPRPSVQPAGYAFAIWGLIYLWLILHAGFGLLRRRGDADYLRPAPALIGALILGTLWLAIAGNYPITATLVILVMAALALTAYLRADPSRERWLLAAPLAIFAGWLTAAAAVSLGVILAGYGILSDTASALTMLILVLAIALSVQAKRPQMPVYGATVTWAIIGIVAANWGHNAAVANASLAGALAMGLATIGLGWSRKPVY